EQSRSDTEKLIADMTSLLSNHVCRQNDMVATKLLDLRKNGTASKSFMDEHVSSMGDILSCSKRKWDSICTQAEKDARDTAEFSVTKHGYMEELLQQSINTAQSAFQNTKKTHEVINEIGAKHISEAVSLIRDATDSNEQHDIEINSARVTAEEDVAKNSDDVLQRFD
ncbi:hypothetical protein TSUD_25190, partial [Trifolium subterraneum]